MGVGGELKKKINAELSKIRTKVQSREILKIVGDEAIEIIRTRTRKGQGVDRPGGSNKKLAPLAPSTIEARERKRLSPETSPSESNLTETGKMLDNLKTIPRKGVVTIRGGDNEDDNKIAYAHFGSDNRPERPFLFLSEKEGEDLLKRLKAAIAKILNR